MIDPLHAPDLDRGHPEHPMLPPEGIAMDRYLDNQGGDVLVRPPLPSSSQRRPPLNPDLLDLPAEALDRWIADAIDGAEGRG